MEIRRLFTLLATATLMAGCAWHGILGGNDKLEPNGGGYIAASLGYRIDDPDPKAWKRIPPSMRASFHQVTRPSESFDVHTGIGPRQLSLWDSPGVIREANGRLAMTVIQVPAGRYQLKSVSSEDHTANKKLKMELKEMPVIEVRPGEVTYAGSIELDVRVGKTILGFYVPVDGVVHVVDQGGRDIEAMQKIDPRFAAIPFRNGLREPAILRGDAPKSAPEQARLP